MRLPAALCYAKLVNVALVCGWDVCREERDQLVSSVSEQEAAWAQEREELKAKLAQHRCVGHIGDTGRCACGLVHSQQS